LQHQNHNTNRTHHPPPQVQQQQYAYREHFERVASAIALPVGAGALHWALLWVMGLLDQRVVKRIKALEDAKRAMIKELKVRSGQGRLVVCSSRVGAAEVAELASVAGGWLQL